LFLRGVAFALLVAFASPAIADDVAGDFDFYVLSLTWTPTYCATADNPSAAQCDGEARGFLVHGLWPEYDRGYPENCASRLPDRLPQTTLGDIADLMPDGGLVGYEWRKHGLCSGLSANGYFSLMRKAREKIQIPATFRAGSTPSSLPPAKIEAAFAKANPGLSMDGMAIKCGGNQLTEVRICLTKTLEFRRCPSVDTDTCHASSVAVPSIH
jgi:ribonuclease T2